MSKTPAAKWVVKKVVVNKWGVAVPLRIDPETGEFWFEYPEGRQYIGANRKAVTRGIHQVVEAYHTEGTWTQHIAVEELANEYRLRKEPDHVPAHVGFRRLFRFERSRIEVRLPNIQRSHSETHDLAMIKEAHANPESTYYWRKFINDSYRPFTGDDGYLYLGDEGRPSFSIHGCLVFDYDEELWSRLFAIYTACTDMHQKLRKLLEGKPDEVQAKIMKALGPGLPLLGDGS